MFWHLTLGMFLPVDYKVAFIIDLITIGLYVHLWSIYVIMKRIFFTVAYKKFQIMERVRATWLENEKLEDGIFPVSWLEEVNGK